MNLRCSTCEGKIVKLDNFSVCSDCGLTNTMPFDMADQVMYNRELLFQNTYSRKKRFMTLFDKLFFPHPDRKDEDCLKFLDNKMFELLEDLVECLKTSPLQDKRYCSLHSFARRFVSAYAPPSLPKNIFTFKKFLVEDFTHLEFLHQKYTTGVPFFNYPWLLKKLLTVRGVTQFHPFIKPIKCKRRKRHYEELYTKLLKKDATRDYRGLRSQACV